MDQLKVLHIEDADLERRDMAIAFKKVNNLLMVGSVAEADEGLSIVKEYMPDVVILDLELREGSKDGLYFLQGLQKLIIPYKPFVLVTTYNSSEAVFSPARDLGADFVYSKTQRDYGTDLVIQFLANIQESLLKNKSVRKTIYSEDNAQKFVMQIEAEFKKIGLKRRLKGYKYLKDAIQLLYENTENYIETIAGKYGVTAKKVDDDMRYAIRSTWNTSAIEDLFNNYTAPVNSRTGSPTVKEFTDYYCEKIKDMLNGQ